MSISQAIVDDDRLFCLLQLETAVRSAVEAVYSDLEDGAPFCAQNYSLRPRSEWLPTCAVEEAEGAELGN